MQEARGKPFNRGGAAAQSTAENALVATGFSLWIDDVHIERAGEIFSEDVFSCARMVRTSREGVLGNLSKGASA